MLGATSGAAAQAPSDGEKKAAAQALFDEAKQLTAAGKYDEACPKFLESKRLDPTMGSKFYLADCFEHVGKLASAWIYYLEAADAARAGGLKDRQKFADERAEALKPRLARLAIKVPDAVRAVAGLSILRDGTAVGEAQWGSAIPIDLGAHVVAATAPQRTSVEVKVEATREGEVVEVIVPALAPVAAPPPPPPLVSARKVEPPPPPPPPPPSGAGRRTAGFVIGGVGVVGVGIGVGLGVLALGKKSQSNSNSHCDTADTCDTIGLGLRSDALTAATGLTVGFVLGGLALVGGVVLVATAPGREGGHPQPAAPQVALGPGSASLAWRW